MLLSLAVRRACGDAGAADGQFRACAAQEHHLSLADARAHALIAGQIAAPAKWPVRLARSDSVSEPWMAFAEAVERIAVGDPSAAHHGSHVALPSDGEDHGLTGSSSFRLCVVEGRQIEADARKPCVGAMLQRNIGPDQAGETPFRLRGDTWGRLKPPRGS
jgi:hypothetical protein